MQTIYYDNNIIHEQFKIVNGKLNGPYFEYNQYGQIIVKAFFKDGLLDNIGRVYNDEGELIQKSHYKTGQLNGRSLNYNHNQLTMISHYKNGLKEGNVYHINEKRQIFCKQYYKQDKCQQEITCLE